MKDGHCPMCNSTEVYANYGAGFRASNPKVLLFEDLGNLTPPTAFVPYICINCGYTATYSQEMDAINDLPKAKGWTKVMKE